MSRLPCRFLQGALHARCRHHVTLCQHPTTRGRGVILAPGPGVTLRITTRRDAGGDVVAIDGHLAAEGVDELQRAVAGLSGPLRLELAGLRSVDEAGLQALRGLRAAGAALTGLSQYFQLLVGPEQRRKAREPPSGLEGG